MTIVECFEGIWGVQQPPSMSAQTTKMTFSKQFLIKFLILLFLEHSKTKNSFYSQILFWANIRLLGNFRNQKEFWEYAVEGGGHNLPFFRFFTLTSCFWTFFGCWFRKSYSFWLKINIQPAHLCTKLARMSENRHFCVELVPTVLWLFLGNNILVSLVKRLPNRPLTMSQALYIVWGQIDEIWNTRFSAFFTYFKYFSWGCSKDIWLKKVLLTQLFHWFVKSTLE